MTPQPIPAALSQPQPSPAPRQPYAPPRLTVHGTIMTLTQAGGIGGGDTSGTPDGG
jgi:hypothetical protein